MRDRPFLEHLEAINIHEGLRLSGPFVAAARAQPAQTGRRGADMLGCDREG